MVPVPRRPGAPDRGIGDIVALSGHLGLRVRVARRSVVVRRDDRARRCGPASTSSRPKLTGFGRRWNYGVMHTSASGPGPDGALDRVHAGRARRRARRRRDGQRRRRMGRGGRVGAARPARASLRPRRRHRVADGARTRPSVPGSIAVYFPRREAVEHYERARDAGTGGDRAALLGSRRQCLRGSSAPRRTPAIARTTPAPDVPVLSLSRAERPQPALTERTFGGKSRSRG